MDPEYSSPSVGILRAPGSVSPPEPRKGHMARPAPSVHHLMLDLSVCIDSHFEVGPGRIKFSDGHPAAHSTYQ